ncbi:Carbon-nitrogen hydrolase [Coemansia sp. RSA 1933]|nr:Carbon-nitrogen hydrolase [Coemansia sp. RSA 1933]
MPDRLTHRGEEEEVTEAYGGASSELKITEMAAGIGEEEEEEPSAEGMGSGEPGEVHGDKEDPEDYDMVEHDEVVEEHGEVLEEAYVGEHEYADYEMDQDGEYAGTVAETDAGSILATQEHGGSGDGTGDHHHQGEYDAYGGDDKEHHVDGMSVDEDGHVIEEDAQQQQHNGHDQASHEIYDDQTSQLYESTHAADGATMEYPMMASDDGAHSSLEALSHVISSNVRQLTGGVDAEEVRRQEQQNQDDEDEHTIAQADEEEEEAENGTGHKMKTPIRFKSQARRLAEAEGGPRTVTPIKRPISRSRDAQSSSRLKSKVWEWYEVLPDGYRQCKFCPQRYGRLTATTILARHFHNRHDANASPTTTPTALRRPPSLSAARRQPSHSRGSGQRVITLPNGQVIDMADSSSYSQAAIAAVAAAAAVAEDEFSVSADHQSGQTGDGSVAAPFGDAAYEHESVDDAHRSESQHSPFDDNPLMMQGSFSAMMTSPLSRLGLAPARSAIAAVAQFCAQGDIRKNLQTCVDLIGGAARRGAQMVFLPEASDFIADSRDLTTQLAQGMDGEFMKEIQQAAKDNGIWVSIGIHEQPPTNEMPYNTNAVVSSDGTLVSVYRKLHMFDVNVKDGPRLIESTTTTRGSSLPEIVASPVGRLGSAVCYDLRFPELAQALRLRGAQVLSFPSAFTELTGAAHWEILMRARAVETQTYVFGAAQIGRHNSRRSSYGDALIVDPWGTVLARCARNTNEPTLATAEINLDYLDKIRREMPVFDHKRSDLFSEYAA